MSQIAECAKKVLQSRSKQKTISIRTDLMMQGIGLVLSASGNLFSGGSREALQMNVRMSRGCLNPTNS